MKKFLVIDDSENRKDSYCRVFNFLNLDFAFTKKEFLEKIKQKFDGYIVDIMYDAYKFEEYDFQKVLSSIPEKKPLFIISSQWTKAMDDMKMKYIRENGKNNDVLGYLSWESIKETKQEEYVRDFVREQITHYFDLAYGAFEDDQSISILQISDIEFGNPGQKSDIETERAKIVNKVKDNLRRLSITNGKVDFICVCGDIAFTGEKSEYSEAKKWLIEFGNALLVNKNFENMLIVPGNHDYSYDASAGNYYKYTYNKDAEKGEYIERDSNPHLEYHEHAIYNFAKFVYELNGNCLYLKNPYQPIVKRTYENYGLNFILLNPIKTGFDKKFEYGMADSDMKYLIEIADDMDKDVCNIVLSHFASEKYSMIDSTADVTNRNIKSIVNTLQVKGWFYGHAHEDESIDDKTVGDHKVLVSRTQSLMLENGQHCDESGNGFTIFRLDRKAGKVINISYYNEKKGKIVEYPNIFKNE